MPKKKLCYQCHLNASLQCQRREVHPKCLDCLKANATASPHSVFGDGSGIVITGANWKKPEPRIRKRQIPEYRNFIPQDGKIRKCRTCGGRIIFVAMVYSEKQKALNVDHSKHVCGMVPPDSR